MPSARTTRCSALLALLLLAAGSLASAWHAAHEAHAWCAEHAALEHGAHAGRHAARAPDDAAPGLGHGARHAGHEACELGPALGERPLAPSGARAVSLPAAPAPRPVAPRHGVARGVALLRLAPKTSPPRAG